jgi:hypothetical protein
MPFRCRGARCDERLRERGDQMIGKTEEPSNESVVSVTVRPLVPNINAHTSPLLFPLLLLFFVHSPFHNSRGRASVMCPWVSLSRGGKGFPNRTEGPTGTPHHSHTGTILSAVRVCCRNPPSSKSKSWVWSMIIMRMYNPFG